MARQEQGHTVRAWPRGPRTPARILVVDDDRRCTAPSRVTLELEGYEVEVASDGLEALESSTVAADEPDLVVLDVLMPNLDGLRPAARSGPQPRAHLMLTAREEVDERVEGLEAGADDYLGKPFAVVELIARVRRSSGAAPTDGPAVRRSRARPRRAPRHGAAARSS